MIFCKLGRPGEECFLGSGSSLLMDWALTSPGWVILFAVGAPCRLLLGSPGAFLVIDVFLTSTPPAAGLVAADPGHMAQALALIAAGDPAVLVEEFNCMVYIAPGLVLSG